MCVRGAFLEAKRILTHRVPAWSSPEDINLSKNRSLRAIEITMLSIEFSMRHPLTTASNFEGPFSTITSPVFSDVVIVFQDKDIPPTAYRRCGIFPRYVEAIEARIRREAFRVLHDLHKVRDFKSVLCANVWGYLEDYAVRELERFVATEWRKAGGDNPSPEPLVTSRPRGFFLSPDEPRDEVRERARWTLPWAPNSLCVKRSRLLA